MSRTSPFYLGFVGALGVFTAMTLMGLLGRLSAVFVLVVVSLFLALSLDPLVQALQRRGLPRRGAVAIVLLVVVGACAGFVSLVSQPLVEQGSALVKATPDLLERLRTSKVVSDLDREYGVIARVSTSIEERLSTGDNVSRLFGGVFGAGKALVSGVFSTFTVLVLTLYFLASLHSMADAIYHLVPASRRERVRLIGDEIIRRIGGYVAGQLGVATVNGLCTFLMVTILDLPYAVVLAITVGILGLIPMIGALLGACVVLVVALFQSWQLAVGVAIYYVIYQQIENYVVMPRIMSKTVAVPGSVAVIAALAGGAMFGVLGALVSIPLAAAILLIIQEVVVPRQDTI
jgi:predicted PurR-regulated permease PerM